MTFLEGQIETCKAWIVYHSTMIQSGAYKNKGTTKFDGTPLTEAELLDNAMATLRTHCMRLSECTDMLPTEKDKPCSLPDYSAIYPQGTK